LSPLFLLLCCEHLPSQTEIARYEKAEKLINQNIQALEEALSEESRTMQAAIRSLSLLDSPLKLIQIHSYLFVSLSLSTFEPLIGWRNWMN
jgi:hypothetical protein